MTPRYAVGIIHYLDSTAASTLISESLRWDCPPAHLYVADNSSNFELSPGVDVPESFVQVIDMGENRGYGTAANWLLKRASSDRFDYLLLLTQDAVLRLKTAGLLLDRVVKDPRTAIAAPNLMFSSDPEKVFSDGGVLTKRGRTLHPAQGAARNHRVNVGDKEVDWADGACLMIDIAAAQRVGGFDENFFLYVEEVEFQYRLRRQGYRIVVVGAAEANQEPGNYSLYYKYRNLCYFTSKHRDSLMTWPWYLAILKDGPKAILRGHFSETAWAFKGLFDNRQGIMGRKPDHIVRERKS